jgi:hypothetical protein
VERAQAAVREGRPVVLPGHGAAAGPAAEGLHSRRFQRSVEVRLGEVLVGSIHHDPTKNCVYARCGSCQHRITRTLLAGRRGRGQGRPLGFLAAWLRLECHGHADHRARAVGITLAERQAARAALLDASHLEELECPAGPGEDVEPEGFS